MVIKKSPSLIIISSPSGAGKSTLCQMLVKRNKNIKLSISATTRKPRKSEIEGHHYFFISSDKFNQMVADNQFIEYAKVFDNYYGTPKKMIEQEIKKGNLVLFDIDWQGSRQIIKKFNPEKIISFFILPPSMEELKTRLRNRAEDNEDVVYKRMQKAQDEISHFNEYDYVIVNDDLESSYQKIYNLIHNQQIECDKENTKSFVKNFFNN